MKTLLLYVLMLLPMVTFANPVEVNGIYYNLLSKTKQAEVTSNPNRYSGSLDIPNSVVADGVEYKVTTIGYCAFSACSELISINIPNSIISIGELAFWKCNNLTTIQLPNNLTEIGARSFEECTSLRTINIPDGIQSLISTFKNCKNLESIIIPNSIKSIGGSFSGCEKLKSVNIPDGIVDIGRDTFKGCTSLSYISIPNSVTVISNNAFAGCSGLTSIEIPNSVKSIYYGAFQGCYGLTYLKIPDSVTYMDNYAFYGCSNVEEITISRNLTDVGEYCFAECSNITSVEIPSKLTNIRINAFLGCSKLAVIILHNEIIDEMSTPRAIQSGAFANCPEITDVYCYSKKINGNNASNIFQDSYINYAILHVSQSLIESYANAKVWKDFKEIVPVEFPVHKFKYVVDGVVYKYSYVEEGTSITPEPEPAKEGYIFSGWSEIPETMPAHDVTITGTFSINSYKLTYQVDGEEYKTLDVEFAATITPEVEPTKEGYTFSGWSEIPATMPAHDVTITGTFTQETGIDQIMSNQNGKAMIFTIDGKRVDNLKKGLNVIRMQDGTMRKVVVK